MEIRRDPVTQSWVVSGQRERVEEGDTPCPFDPPAIDSLKTILSFPPEGPWRVRVVPHPEPLYRVEIDPGRAAEGIYDKIGPLGAHELIVETPQHDKRLSQLGDDEIVRQGGSDGQGLHGERERPDRDRRVQREQHHVVLVTDPARWKEKIPNCLFTSSHFTGSAELADRRAGPDPAGNSPRDHPGLQVPWSPCRAAHRRRTRSPG